MVATALLQRSGQRHIQSEPITHCLVVFLLFSAASLHLNQMLKQMEIDQQLTLLLNNVNVHYVHYFTSITINEFMQMLMEYGRLRNLSKANYLQFVFFAVDDDSCDLLVHEDKDGAEHGGYGSCQNCPPGVPTNRVNQPAAVIPCRLTKNIFFSRNIKKYLLSDR